LISPGDRTPHTLILVTWIGWIFFSSTSIAGRWARQFYEALSAHSGLGEGMVMLLFQKGYHVFLFGVLGWLIVSAPSSRPLLMRAMLWTFVIGALSEALQMAFHGRGPSFADVLLNGISGSAAAWIWLRVICGRQKTAPRAVSGT
jgi:hypothetical protein